MATNIVTHSQAFVLRMNNDQIAAKASLFNIESIAAARLNSNCRLDEMNTARAEFAGLAFRRIERFGVHL